MISSFMTFEFNVMTLNVGQKRERSSLSMIVSVFDSNFKVFN